MTKNKTEAPEITVEKESSSFLGRDQLLSFDDVVIEKVTLPAPYNGHVFVKNASGFAWDEYQDSILVKDKDGSRTVELKGAKVKLLSHCVCDENGVLIFTQDDILALSKKSNLLLETLTKVAQRLNGMGVETKEKN